MVDNNEENLENKSNETENNNDYVSTEVLEEAKGIFS